MLRHADVGKLLTVDSEDPLVLSLYLEMPQYLPGLREVPDRVRRLLATAADASAGQVSPPVMAAAEREVRKVLEGGARHWLGRGAGIFLCGPAGLAERILLPAGLGERAVFAARPHVRPLLTALRRWPGYQVALVTRQHAWLFTVAGEQVGVPGQLPSGARLRGPDPDGWQWLGSSRASEPIGRFPCSDLRDAAVMLGAIGGSNDEGPLVLAGHPGTIPEFLAMLPGSLRDRFAGSFAADPAVITPARIRELAGPVVRQAMDRSAQELLTRIRDEQPGTALAGLTDCLAAVNQGAVAALAVPGRGTVPGHACRQCGALGTAKTGCICGPGAAHPVPDLIEEMAVAVIHAGGTVQTVDDVPGGIAACLRFPDAGRTRSVA